MVPNDDLPPPSQSDDDLAARTPTPLARLCGGLAMIMGLFTMVQAVQLWTFVLRGWVALVPYLLIACGVTTIALGLAVTKLRGRATIASTSLSGVMSLLFGAWVVYGLAGGFVSLVGFAMPPLALGAAVAIALVIPASLRADRARQRLQAQGLGLGT